MGHRLVADDAAKYARLGICWTVGYSTTWKFAIRDRGRKKYSVRRTGGEGVKQSFVSGWKNILYARGRKWSRSSIDRQFDTCDAADPRAPGRLADQPMRLMLHGCAYHSGLKDAIHALVS